MRIIYMPFLTALLILIPGFLHGATPEAQPAKRPVLNAKAACLAGKGTWSWPGIPHQGEPDEHQGICVVKLPDAGKSCTGSEQCQGLCLGTYESEKTGRGVCASTNYNSGCRSIVSNGKASPVICID